MMMITYDEKNINFRIKIQIAVVHEDNEIHCLKSAHRYIISLLT